MNGTLYFNNGSDSDQLQQLKNNQLIKDFAAVKPDTLELIRATNPTLFMFVQVAKKIMEAEG